MLFLLIACAAGVYLWQHAPALFMLLAAGGLLWYVVIPLCIIVVCGVGMALVWGFVGLSWLANALPDWRIFREPPPKPEPVNQRFWSVEDAPYAIGLLAIGVSVFLASL